MPVIARGDFDFYGSGIPLITDDEPPQYLHLFKEESGMGSPELSFAPKITVVADQGVTHGSISLSFTSALSSGSQNMGIACMQSQRDLSSGGGGQAYTMAYHPTSGIVRLWKLTDGLRTSPTLLEQTTFGTGVAEFALFWLLSPRS